MKDADLRTESPNERLVYRAFHPDSDHIVTGNNVESQFRIWDRRASDQPIYIVDCPK